MIRMLAFGVGLLTVSCQVNSFTCLVCHLFQVEINCSVALPLILSMLGSISFHEYMVGFSSVCKHVIM